MGCETFPVSYILDFLETTATLVSLENHVDTYCCSFSNERLICPQSYLRLSGRLVSVGPIHSLWYQYMRELETVKAVWIQKQLDIAARAIFTDHDLSFNCVPKEKVVDKQAQGDLNLEVLEHNDMDEPHVRHQCSELEGLHTVGGLDISFAGLSSPEAVATAVILSYPGLKVNNTFTSVWRLLRINKSDVELVCTKLLHELSHSIRMTEPYIPSFLAMREAGHLVTLVEELRLLSTVPFPQVFFIDGNGRLHERQAGLATVVGVLANVPTIGCAKDYSPPYSELVSKTSGKLQTDWRTTQKGFKHKAKEVLKKRGDWIGIYDCLGEEYSGAVRVIRAKACRVIVCLKGIS